MKRSHALGKLSKFLTYILGRQPDEFGLVPDENGYVKTKDLMKVLAEEPGWRHVRLNQIREMIHTSRSPEVEHARMNGRTKARQATRHSADMGPP